MSGKKFLTPEVWGKKFFSNLITRTPPQKSNGQPLRGWETKQIWHLSKWHSSTKWLARGHHVVVFKFCILKRHKWKGKVQNNAQFPFYGHKKGFCHEIVCRGRFLHFDIRAKEKPQNVLRFEIDFMLNFAMCSADLTWVNGSAFDDPVSVTRIAFKD